MSESKPSAAAERIAKEVPTHGMFFSETGWRETIASIADAELQPLIEALEAAERAMDDDLRNIHLAQDAWSKIRSALSRARGQNA